MARFRALIVIVVAVALGGAFAFFTYRYVRQLQTPVAAAPIPVPTSPVVVAAAKLDLGREIDAEDIRVIQWPADSVPPGAIGEADEVLGRGLIVGVVENEILLDGKLAPREAGAGLPPAIPEGMRALSVRVNEVIGVAGYVLPGTHVDVVVTIAPGGNVEMTSKIVLTNVLVLAAGTKIERDLENNQPISVTVVTLLVNPVEAERLTLASTEGKIQLALRNPLDREAPPTSGIRPAALITGAGPVRPRTGRPSGAVAVTAAAAPPPPLVVPPAPPATVEIIRGDKRVRETVPRLLVYADPPQPASPASETTTPETPVVPTESKEPAIEAVPSTVISSATLQE